MNKETEERLEPAKQSGILDLSWCSLKTVAMEKLINVYSFLRVLDISNNRLTRIPEAIGLALSLSKLDCSNNTLRHLPCNLGKCVHLSELKASTNSLKKLPSELSRCSSLKELILSCNDIEQWPPMISSSFSELICLKLDNNPLKNIPEKAFRKILQLEILDLSGVSSASTIFGQLKYMSELKELHLRNTNQEQIPDGISNLTKLAFLDLSRNRLTTFDELLESKSILELDLSNNYIESLPLDLRLRSTNFNASRLNGNPVLRSGTDQENYVKFYDGCSKIIHTNRWP